MKMDLIIAGVGGQGSILAARIVAGAAMQTGEAGSHGHSGYGWGRPLVRP
ncbi:MAG: hypothetical protein ACOX37_11495 [Bacillota bacterium]